MKLNVTNLTKYYDKNAVVDHVNLEFTTGIVGLLGPNGAGKTTMIRLLCDLIQPDDGAVLLDGEDICSLGEDYRDVLGYLPQKMGYYPWFSAEKYLLYIGTLKGLSDKEASIRAEELLKQVGLYEERKKKLGTFSGGMLQRIGIAQALLNEPKILILDEPTAGLDPQERIRFRSIIAGLAKNRLIILSTHIVSDVEHIASQVVLLSSGKVIAHDTVENIRQSLVGKVYTVTVSTEEAEDYRKSYLVSNMQPLDDKIVLRIVDFAHVPEDVNLVEPSLEDAYLAYCGREEIC